MPQAEFAAWVAFYRAYPFDDLHRFHRPAALITQAFAGGDINEKLNWLQPPEWHADFADADLRTIQALGLKR